MKSFDEQLRQWERLQEKLPGGPDDDDPDLWDDEDDYREEEDDGE